MKKQLSFITRSLLLSGVAVIMCTSCIFIPPKEKEDVVKTEEIRTSDGKVIYKKNGLTCVWQDDFDYTGVPDVDKWKYQTGAGGWGNNELQTYRDNTTEAKTAVVEDGVLKIKAFKENGKWVSARLNSKESWKYGFIEARLKVTDRKGAWPAFWMMPEKSAYGIWPNSGEIDIMENAPATCGDHKVFSTLHAQGHNGANGVGIGSKVYGDDLSSDWHTFGIMWTEDKITCYYDDVEKKSYENNGTVKDWPYDKEFYIILNLAIGGDLGGTREASTLGDSAEFQIDYVRVYQ